MTLTINCENISVHLAKNTFGIQIIKFKISKQKGNDSFKWNPKQLPDRFIRYNNLHNINFKL